jgi:propanol-preferring alcohol dehydrogenase
VGTVVKVGPNVSESLINQRVGIKWLYSACNECSACSKALPRYCPKQSNTGRTVPGTLQQYALADARFITRIPDGLPDEIVAPLLCAGLTMAGAISRLDNGVRPGDWVVVIGSGGGLRHIGVQIAARLKGYRVIAVDSTEAKRRLSLDSGAEAFIDFATEDVEARVKELTGEGAHAVLAVSGSEASFTTAPKLVRNLGVIVCVGLPRNDFNLPISTTGCAARGMGPSTYDRWRSMRRLITFIGLTIKVAAVGTEKQMD